MGRTASKISLLFALFVCPALHGQDSINVAGSVVDSVTQAGLPGVAVYFGTQDGLHYDAVTDASGRFQIAGMKDGEYGSHVEKDGYVAQYSGRGDSTLKNVRISAGQDTIRLRLELAAFAGLRGRVLDPDGKPAPNVTVTLGQDKETTDDRGQFAFTAIAPASYTLQAVPAPRAQTVQTSGEDRTEIVPTWFPSVSESTLAEAVNVRAGADLAGYDIRLRTSTVYKVRGIVLGLDGKPVARAQVRNAPASDQAEGLLVLGGTKMMDGGPLGFFTILRSQVGFSEDAQNTKDGVFEFPSVPRGTRVFAITPDQEYSKDSPIPQPVMVSTVVDHDIDDLEIRLAPPFAVEGTFELAGTAASATPEAIRHATVVLQNAGGIRSGGRLDSGFRFDSVVAGEGRIVPAPGVAGGYYLDSIGFGGQNITGQSMNLQAGAPPVRVVYKPNGATVSGTVEAAADTMVLLIPQAALDSRAVDSGRVTPTGPGGAFEIDSLAPGSYYVFAVDRFPVKLNDDPATTRRIVSAAEAVQVSEGAAVRVRLKAFRPDE